MTTIEQAIADAGGTGRPIVQACPGCGRDTIDPAYYSDRDRYECGAVMDESETAWLCYGCATDGSQTQS